LVERSEEGIRDESTAPRRVVVIGPAHPYRGGIAHFNEMTMRGLTGRGHGVQPITFTRQYPKVLFPGKTQFADDEAPPSDLPAAERIIDTLNPLTWWQAARRVVEQKPDAVLFQYWMPYFAPAYGVIARWARRQGIRVLAIVHNALPHERHVGDAALSRFFLRAVDGLVVMSDAVAEELVSLRRTDAAVRQVEHPVYARFGEALPREKARAELDLPPDTPVLLFFGFVREYKGLHVLLDALPAVVGRLPNAQLVIAGEFYDDPAPYRAQIQQAGLADRVTLHDRYIPSETVPAYFSAADCVVQPYVSATQSGVAQIAFHFERPIIVTDVGGLAEVVPHEQAGFVVPPEDPDALADHIVRFFQEDWRDRLEAGVRRQKERYHPDRLADAIDDLLRGMNA
jgi:glycosyltransferase involved in cell wall biosynthesis